MSESEEPDDPGRKRSKKSPVIAIRAAGALAFVAALVVQLRAERIHDWKVAQFTEIAAIDLVVAAIIGFALQLPRKT